MSQENASPYSNHDDILALLPWYLNGSLVGDESDRVKSHLQVCLICRKELAEHQQLAKNLRSAAPMEVSVQSSFQRLMSRIDAEENPAVMTKVPQRTPHKTTLASRLAQRYGGLFNQKPAFAFAAALFALSLSILTFEHSPINTNTYRTVANTGALSQFSENDIRLVFAERIADSDIAALIRSVHGTIVNGPTELGVYTIRIDKNTMPGHSLKPSIDALRASKQIVMVEPALPAGND